MKARTRGIRFAKTVVLAGSIVLIASCSSRPVRTDSAKGGADSDGDTKGVQLTCDEPQPGKAPLRRLTRFEYNKSVRDIFGDDSHPASALPAEELGNGFGNDAAQQSVSSLLANQYALVGKGVAAKVLETDSFVAKYAACLKSVTTSSEKACSQEILESVLPLFFRRAISSSELTEYRNLFAALRKNAPSFSDAIKDTLATALEAPDFLYRVELGDLNETVGSNAVRLASYELATWLSFLFWASVPDEALMKAAQEGKLSTKAEVMAQAKRLLGDERAQQQITYFFDQLLPINALTELERDKTLFPQFSPQIGSLMYRETHRYLSYVLFEDGPGDWGSVFSQPYTFVNETLAKYYGISGVTGDSFQKVSLDGKTRLGLLTQGAFLAGTTHSSMTNPVYRGSLVMQKLLCRTVPLPTGELAAFATTPVVTEGTTARERFTRHSEEKVCASCHKLMDPIGLTFENYDAIGLYRTQESEKTIDASGALPDGIDNAGPVSNAVELSKRISESSDTQYCFAEKWMTFAYGKTLDKGDTCTQDYIKDKFKKSGYNVRNMLLQLTQADAFFYRPSNQE